MLFAPHLCTIRAMTTRIAIVEDVPAEASLLQYYIETYCNQESIPFEVDIYTGSRDYLAHAAQSYDILFLDIEFSPDEENGMELAHTIRRKDEKCRIVFVTNLGKFAIEGYQVNALDFILKPLNYESFRFRFASIVHQLQNVEGEAIVVKSKGAYHKVLAQDIYYVCIINHICYFYGVFHEGESEDNLGTYEAWTQLSAVEKELDPRHFVRCSSSYLINVTHVNKILKDTIIVGKTTLPLSRHKKKGVITAYLANFGNV